MFEPLLNKNPAALFIKSMQDANILTHCKKLIIISRFCRPWDLVSQTFKKPSISVEYELTFVNVTQALKIEPNKFFSGSLSFILALVLLFSIITSGQRLPQVNASVVCELLLCRLMHLHQAWGRADRKHRSSKSSV